MEINPYELDWGEAFVESYNTDTKSATLIYNFNFLSLALFSKFIAYSVGHMYWVMLNLPAESSVAAIFDLRGMDISEQFTSKIAQEVKEAMRRLTDKHFHIVFKR
jgi:hypothetical protein